MIKRMEALDEFMMAYRKMSTFDYVINDSTQFLNYIELFAQNDVLVLNIFQGFELPDEGKTASKMNQDSLIAVKNYFETFRLKYPVVDESKITSEWADFTLLETKNMVTYRLERSMRFWDQYDRNLKTSELIELELQFRPESGKYVIFKHTDLKHTIECIDYCVDKSSFPDPTIQHFSILAHFGPSLSLGRIRVDERQPGIKDIDQSYYPDVVSSGTNLGNWDWKSQSLATTLSLELDFLIAKRDNLRDLVKGERSALGFSTGIGISFAKGEIRNDGVQIQFRSEDVFGSTYNRQVRMSNWYERIAFSTIQIPLLLTYQYNFTNTLAFFGSAGLLITPGRELNYKSSAEVDFEALYYYSEISNNFQFSLSQGPLAMEMTEESFERYYGSQAEEEWNARIGQGYDLGVNKTLSDETDWKLNTTNGFLARIGIAYDGKQSTRRRGGFWALGLEIKSGITRWTGDGLALSNRSGERLGSLLYGLDEMKYSVTSVYLAVKL
ncbi:MAG: hypothetical protein ACKVOK_16755 [Flavobacteriales bacterium]